MRISTVFMVLFICVETANALTPLPDSSPGFFAGEWSGIGGQGSYCYINMKVDGRGVVLIDSGSGDWLGAQIQWRNRKQAVEVEKITPLPASSQLRIMPLDRFSLSTAFNQSLKLTLNGHSDGCYLQKIDTTANNLARARNVAKKTPPLSDTK